MIKFRLVAAIAAALLTSAGLSGAADLRSPPPPSGSPAVVAAAPALVPGCGDPRVLAQIEDQFEYGAPRVLPAPLQVAQFSNLEERAYFPRGGYRKIERRYCRADALIAGAVLPDSKSGMPYTSVYYVIEHPMGFASLGWRAEGCFLGFDKWRVYGANCESLRRF